MTVKHIIFDASVLAKFPQIDNFFKAAHDSAMGTVDYIRSHCVPRTDIRCILDLLQRKNIDVIVLSRTATGAGQVLDAFGIPYSRSISSLDEIEDERYNQLHQKFIVINKNSCNPFNAINKGL